MQKLTFYLSILIFMGCGAGSASEAEQSTDNNVTANKNVYLPDSGAQSIHIYVALCDNKYQGIVPVSTKVGNGQDPANNLYWGWGYGIKTYFKNSKEWKFIGSKTLDGPVLERLLFQHTSKNYYLIADAYDGREMKNCIKDFLSGLSGNIKDTVKHLNKAIGTAGNAKLLAFIGHDGLMDFQLNDRFEKADSLRRDCMILACYSKKYFSHFITQTGAYPLLWASNLMGPEAYTIHDAITGYINKESAASIQMRAAKSILSIYKMLSESCYKFTCNRLVIYCFGADLTLPNSFSNSASFICSSTKLR